MSGLFSKGPSKGDIYRSEQAAFKREAERLRIEEQKLRQRESDETIQGEGIATTGAVSIGNDTEQTATGGESIEAINRGPEPITAEQQQVDLIKALENVRLTGWGGGIL